MFGSPLKSYPIGLHKDEIGEPHLQRGWDEVSNLINEVVASNVNRTAVKNSLYESDNFHIDAVPIGGKGASRCKVEVQEKKGKKDTVAVAVLEMHVNSDADVQTALISSLGNQHVWGVS